MSAAVRLKIQRNAGHFGGLSVPPMVRPLLGLSKDEAGRLGDVLPLELVLVSGDQAQESRLLPLLEGAGFKVEITPARVVRPACAAHPKLAGEHPCSECERRWVCLACERLRGSSVCLECGRRLARRALFRQVRIGLLLVVLILVALVSFTGRRRVSSWERPLRVAIHPIAAEAGDIADAYVTRLSASEFQAIEVFLSLEKNRHGLSIDRPAAIELAEPLGEVPPPPPLEPTLLSVVFWSLKLRWWVFDLERDRNLLPSDVRIFVIYFRAESGRMLEHSFGLPEGRIGVVRAFAAPEQSAQNSVLIAHELLHTLGATDKYDAEGQPLFPEGYAEPEQVPRHPQTKAEIMAGRIPSSKTEAEMPTGLKDCVVGPATAREIGWIR